MSIIKKSEIEELVDADGAIIDGGRNVVNNSEIETGPVSKPWNDDSDYEKGVSTTTDRATRYRQDIPWFAVYSSGGRYGRGQAMSEGNIKLTKEQLEKKIEEDLVKKSKDKELLSKTLDAVDNILDKIDGMDLNQQQLDKIKAAVLKKLTNV